MKRCCLKLFLFRGLFLLFLAVQTFVSYGQKVPISFDNYHGYSGTEKYLQDVAKAYPSITSLIDIGKSTYGRSIYVLVVSNMKTGTTIDSHVELKNMRKEGVKNVTPMKPYHGKPGQWICAAMHGNEYTGTEVCLYIIDKLLSGYDNDPTIKELIDNKVFYICPIVNPDGVYNSVEGGVAQRQNSEKVDNDKDGKINEDGPDDLNGDGFVTQFRYKDPRGRYVIDDVDSRLMVRLRGEEKTTRERYSVITEDKDNDKDGERGEDPERGIDVNRNFPEVWFRENGMQGGSGDYPTSSPEAHALAEFFTNHPNIIMGQYFHTSGGFTYRPLGTSPHGTLHPKDVAVMDMIMGKKYLEILGEEVPKAWLYPDSLSHYKKELQSKDVNKYAKQRGYELPRGWRVSYNENRDQRYSFGMASDWMYMQYGVYSVTTELWNPTNDIDDFPTFEGEDAYLNRNRELLAYQDEHYNGEYFIRWEPFTHPELGEGEIGGWKSPTGRNNAFPGKPLLNVCEKHWQFELFRATLLPEVVITDVKAEILYSTNSVQPASLVSADGSDVVIKKGKGSGKYNVIEITAKIENQGKLATHIARGANLARNRNDVVWLIGDRDKVTFLQGTPYQKIGVLEGTEKIPGYRASPTAQSSAQMRSRGYTPYSPMVYRYRSGRISYDQPGEKQVGPKRVVKWLVAVEGNTPLKVVLSSQKGGTRVQTVTY
jgi:hypothetical protein